jgi:hypothetical protein
MAIYTVKIYKSWKGRASNAAQWTNRYNLNLDAAITDASIVTQVNKVVQFEKQIHLTDTHFMRAVVSTAAKYDSDNNPESVRTIDLTGQGERTMDTDAEFLELTMHARFSGATGRSGGAFYRGCLTESMITNGSDGGPAMNATPSAFDSSAAGLLTGLGAGVLVIVSKGLQLASYTGRPVTAILPGQAAVRSRHTTRKKKTVETSAGALTLIANVMQIAGTLAALFFTRGASMAPAARTAIGAAASTAGSVLSGLGKQFTDGVDGPIPGPL